MTELQQESVSWRKSTASAEDACVEVAVEVARAQAMILVRDSKDPLGPALSFSREAWNAFLTSARADQSDI